MSKERTRSVGLVLALLSSFAAGAFCSTVAEARPASVNNAPQDTLTPFESDAQLRRYLKRMARAPRPVPAMAAPAPPSPVSADGATATEAVAVTGSRADSEKITNTQETDVDEGDIVKMHGDTLVILRRGRLFTVATGRGDLAPIDSIDAYPPGADASGDWYDEMLVAGDRVVVIGYSYSRGGTEINRFHIDRDGHLAFEDAYHLRSNDYYSSRNYASRLIGTRLVVYSPLYLPYGDTELVDWLPALQKWTGQETKTGFKRIASARQIFLPDVWRRRTDVDIEALHTVSSCDLAARELHCTATSVLGPNGRTFYVSAHAVYVWVSANRWNSRVDSAEASSLLYRLPLDGSAPSAVGVRGAPVDQFSFREDWDDGKLNVLVRSEGGGDAMWRPEFSTGAIALLRLPLRSFGDGADEVSRSRYRELPKPETDSYSFQNRFVGDYVLYGSGNGWGAPQERKSALVAASVRGDDVFRLALKHGVDRIEAMGRDAVVIGSDEKALHFTAVELTSGPTPELGDSYVLDSASQGETRSHAFFFKPERGSELNDRNDGVIGLPVAREARPAYRQLLESSASMIFLRRTNRAFAPLGELGAREEIAVDDDCKASCVDWYGNARPIFLRDRTFALMGYEIVEGEIGAKSVREVRRINFAPGKR